MTHAREQEAGPSLLRLIMVAQLAVSLAMAVVIGLLTLSPPVTARDAEIRLLQDKLHEQGELINRLQQHTRDVDSYQRMREKYEASAKEEKISRAQLDTRLMQILEACSGPARN